MRELGNRGFANHNLQAAMLLIGLGAAMGIPPAAVLMKSGGDWGVVALVLLGLAGVGPIVLVAVFGIGYVDNGCISTVIMIAVSFAAPPVARLFSFEPPIGDAVSLAAVVAVPWIFYAAVLLPGLLRRLRAGPAKNRDDAASGGSGNEPPPGV